MDLDVWHVEPWLFNTKLCVLLSQSLDNSSRFIIVPISSTRTEFFNIHSEHLWWSAIAWDSSRQESLFPTFHNLATKPMLWSRGMSGSIVTSIEGHVGNPIFVSHWLLNARNTVVAVWVFVGNAVLVHIIIGSARNEDELNGNASSDLRVCSSVMADVCGMVCGNDHMGSKIGQGGLDRFEEGHMVLIDNSEFCSSA